MITSELNASTNYVYTLFIWTASNCSPNRDGGTGEIRVDSRGRVFTTQECFNQNVKNGVFYARNSGLLPSTLGAELMGCKNEFFGPRTLKGALADLLESTAKLRKKSVDQIAAEDIFLTCFDIPMFGLVNSDGLKHPAFPASITGSAGLVYLPKTVTRVNIDNRGISSAFSGPKRDNKTKFNKLTTYQDYAKASTDIKIPKGMPGSHYTDYLEEGVFSCVGIFNVKQLTSIAVRKLGIEDTGRIRARIGELYNLYLTGIWEGFKLLGYASTMRKGQQPFALYSAQCTKLPDFVTDPADLLNDGSGIPAVHLSVSQTIDALNEKLGQWMKSISENWTEHEKVNLSQ